MNAKPEISILIVDDHHIIRHGLQESLAQQEHLSVVAEAETGGKAVALARIHKPDIIIMDVSMPDMNGIEATRKILKENSNIKIIALSMHSEKQFVLSMINAGVSGYLLKTNFFNELLTAIQNVYDGMVYLSAGITKHVVAAALKAGQHGSQSPLEKLTPRERQILQMIAEGKTNADMANQLFISKKTIAAHKLNLMKKLQLNNVPALTKFAVKHGLTTLDL